MRLVNARRILWKSKPDSKKVGACFHPQCRQSFHKITYRRTKGEAKVKPQNKCGPDQPSEPHRSWISLVCLPTARRGGTTALVRQRSRGSATFTSTKCRMRFVESLSAPYAAASGQPARRAGSGEGRNARATSTRSRAFPISPGNSPSRIASCHQRHRNPSFGKP
ncbi:MAG: hypothetical protein QOF94_1098 [Acidobacteriaceae bacterium]